MKDLYFEPGKTKLTFRKHVTLFITHWLTVHFPSISLKLAFKLLGNPFSRRHYEMRTHVKPLSTMIATSHGEVCLHKFASEQSDKSKNIFLCHGWGDSSTRFTQLIDHLVAEDYTVWSLDQFGHGKSTGSYSHLFAFIDGVKCALQYLEDNNARPDTIVGHSMGALSLMNLPENILQGKKVILISAPIKFFENMNDAIATVGIAKSMLLNLLEDVSVKNNIRWQSLTPLENRQKINDNFLFMHDTSDKTCPYVDVKSLLEGLQQELFTTHDMGHLKLLKDPLLFAKISEFSNAHTRA